ncbi:MAG: class I SAM-dependent methyltransferase [Anaerorhabdus sp.]|uniref:class I SAM-dependent methyltransferase n=1 Tax=Anaerorhabdus sp. TaxID=1872524 RepID=UPI003A866842
MILDVCCGSRMFYFDKNNKSTIYMDIRKERFDIHGKHVNVNPDVIGDFRNIPFKNEMFNLVIFDPPHLKWAGPNSIMKGQYGQLDIDTWQQDLEKGFDECMRVLKKHGTLIFKWSECQISLMQVLAVTKYKPLLGNQRGRTHWIVFYKE